VEAMVGVASYDTDPHSRRHAYGMGPSSKRSKRDQLLSYREDSERKEEEEEDAKPRAVDRNQMRRHMADSDKQQEVGYESQEDGSLDDLMKQFQQLIFPDDTSS